jgi:hypothetical protein
MNDNPPTIDHNPHEKRPPWWFWWVVFGVVALLWIGNFAMLEMHWGQIGLGFTTGGLLVAWAMAMTGGEVPTSWRSKPPRQR